MTRDELIEAVALKLWPDMPFNVRAVMTRDLPKFLDALDALGMGPKRVVELEKEVDRLQEGWQTATKMMERGDVNGATHVLSTGMVPSNYHAALKGQSND